MYLTSVSRGANLLLDAGHDKHGLIPQPAIDSLMRLQQNIERFGAI